MRVWLFILLIILSIWFWRDHHEQNIQIEQLQNELDESEQKTYVYSEALDQANSNIENAKSYASYSYYDMEAALDNLETVTP